MKMANFTRIFSSFGRSGILSSLVSAGFLLLATIVYSQGGCPLACNDLVQVSLDADCVATITPEMMLEGEDTSSSCGYLVTVLGPNNQPITSSPDVDGTYIGMTLKVRVSLGQNSCWGRIHIEDKLKPSVDCPPNDTVDCYMPVILPEVTATDNCDPNPTVKKLSDDLVDLDCTFDWSAIRTVTYQAQDKSGNLSDICTYTIYYRRISLDSIRFPLNRDDIDLPALNCNNIPAWDINGNGYPDPSETGVPTTEEGNPIFPHVNYCELSATFSDTRIDICPGSFKILRQWTVLDWCTSLIRTNFQIIKVMDKNGPTIVCPPDATLNAHPWTCTADWQVPAPTVVFDCSNTTYTVAYLSVNPGGDCENPPTEGVYIQDNVIGNHISGYTIKNLPLGCTWIRYSVTDECGNFSFCFTKIEVEDNVPPVAVCDEFTVATLTVNGFARVYAETFDDGSYDNCCDVELEVRRMTPGCQQNTDLFRPYAEFCCDDVGKDIMVELRVTDCVGNSNSCMVITRVQDKINPIISCPPHITVDCGTDIEDLDITGRPNASDNCNNISVSFEDNGSLNDCGVGIIDRFFTVTDAGGRTAQCSQVISVVNNDPFDLSDIKWPLHRTLNGCLNVDSDPSVTGRPTWTEKQCSHVAATYKDQVFTFVDGACFKILRNWTVIDWCTFDPNYPFEGGLWHYTQEIKLSNNSAPTFVNCNNREFCVFGADCDGLVDLVQEATDDCTPAEQLKWSYQIDAFNNGTIDFTGNGNNASRVYPVGVHKITWTVEDRCGNKNTCTYLFTVKDCKKPTPYCLGEITTVIMPSSGSIDIWASDFDLGSFDNCPGTLRFSFSPNVDQTGRTFTCADLGINSLEMWVTDDAGNQEFCIVRINIQSNGACGNSRVGGRIATPDDKGMQGVEVSIENIDNQEVLKYSTNESGKYDFEGLPVSDYRISGEYDKNHANGVSTLDLILIQRHILEHTKFSSPYQYIAADADNNGKVSTADIIELRKLILGAINRLSKNQSWRFVKQDGGFQNPDDPFPFEDAIDLDYQGDLSMNNNFVAVKIGDINFSAELGNYSESTLDTRANKTLTLTTNETLFKSGELVRMDVSSSNFEKIFGMQYTLNFNAEALKFERVEGGAIDITDENLGLHNSENGIITTSWNEPQGLTFDSDEVLFTVIFRAKTSGKLTQNVNITSSVINAEAYGQDLEVFNVALKSRSTTHIEGFEILQNTPNPFSDLTLIRFYLPAEGVATLTVTDITGKVVMTRTNEYSKGLNELYLTAEQLGAPGVYFYQLESGGFKASKKMILISK